LMLALTRFLLTNSCASGGNKSGLVPYLSVS
jgi:hypothetical protein